MKSPQTPDSMQDYIHHQDFLSDRPIQYSKPKVSRKKQLEIKQR